MKRIKYIYSVILIFLTVSLISCSDWFDLYPESETIFEDYWQNENDVLSVVGACYRGMNQQAFMDRVIAWGEVRSDNVLKGANISNDENLTRIMNLMLTSTNAYTSWSDFYSVINICNNVIQNAPDVRQRDPNYTEGQLQAHIAEAKGIRALCHFILLRTFRDIPLIIEPTIDDSKPFEVVQSAPDVVLDYLINDLISVENNALTGYETNIMYDKGRITQKAIRALIADMYLWKNDYDNCILYCNKVLQDITLELELSFYYSNYVFGDGNSSESIFELQFSNQNITNYQVFGMYSKQGFSGVDHYYKLSSLGFVKNTDLFGATDLRGKDSFLPVESEGYYPIMKYVATRAQTTTEVQERHYSYRTSSPNWIFYRLPDIYLMKAEALVEKGGQADLEEAFALVERTYDRANPELGTGSLNFNNYNSQSAMRDLVFDERQREFLFEGKRYYDLLRRINREGNPTNIVNNYLLRKYVDLDQATARSKINDMNAIYMPINEEELRVNSLLKQNPFYEISSGIEKN